jgi:hypothetical protein
MAKSAWRLLPFACMLWVGLSAYGQDVGTRVPEGSTGSSADQPASGADQPAPDTGADRTPEEPPPEKPKRPAPVNLHEWLFGPLSQEEDRDGPINTDRPTFTPANTVVPKGRLQFESGWTFNGQQASGTRSYVYDFPELAMRYGLVDRVEFRMFWEGQTYAQTQVGARGPWKSLNGPSDMEVGFKWQLFPGDEKRKWIPTTALITSIYAPTGGTSPYSSQTVEPYINLIYGWNVTKKLSLGGCTGYLGIREQGAPYQLSRSYNYQRYHQSIVAFYSITENTTLFYEWYILTFTNSANNLPLNYMDGGILYRFTPNIQVDIRAGFGLSGRPNDFFTGTGFSVRF